MAEKRACEKCGRVFSVPPAFLKRNIHHYCTRICFKTHERDPQVRFWRRVAKIGADACWLWSGGTRSDGYGTFTYFVRGEDGLTIGRVSTNAHRYSWELHRGPIPSGMLVCHKCDVRTCVNPDHLFLGSIADNMRDRNAKGRQARHEHQGRAKLTVTAARQIRADHAAGTSKLALARRYGVVHATIRALLSGRTWQE